MSFSLGFIDTASLTNIQNFESVKEDISEEENIQPYRGGDNTLFISNKSAKGEITIDMDWILDADYGNLRKLLLNRAYPNKMYLRNPGNITGAIIHPNTTTAKVFKLASDNPAPSLISFSTEFDSTDYTRINAFTTPCSNGTNAKAYMHYLFTFSLTNWLALATYDNLLRLSLFMQTPAAYCGTDKYGIVVRAYNWTSASWLEIYRRSITLTTANQQCAALRPITGFTQMSDFQSSNLMYFMISTLQPRVSGTMNLESNYVALFVNGFMVRMADNFNLNWREAYTGAGRTGQLKLLEV